MILLVALRRLLPVALAAVAVLSAAGAARAAEPSVGGPLDAVAREAAAELQFAPVQVDGRTLFNVAGLATTLPAEQRAARIAARIAALAEDPSTDVAKLRVETSAGLLSILYGDRLIVSITDPDAALAGVGAETAAVAFVERIGEAIVQYRAEREPASLRDAALRVAAAVLMAALAIGLVLWGLRAAERALDRRYRDRIQAVGIQSFEIVRAERIRGAIGGSISFARLVLIAVALFALVDYALLQFPWTRQTALGLLGAVAAPIKATATGLLAQIPNLAFLAVLFVVVRFVLRLLRLFFEAVANGRVTLKEFEPVWAEPTYKLLRIAVVAFALVVAYPYIPGSSSDAFKGVSIFVGVVFSLASTTTISNMIAGYALIYRRAFKVGDRIRVGDVTGVVTVSRLQVTHLRTVKNEEVIVPNATMLNGTIVNYSSYAHEGGLAVSVAAGIGYETPWRQVEAMLLLAAERTEGVLREPPPFVWHLALGDFCVNYELNAFISDPLAAGRLRTALSRNVLDVFNEYGVQIMTPAYEGDPAEPKIVRREDWHLPPAAPATGASAGKDAPKAPAGE